MPTRVKVPASHQIELWKSHGIPGVISLHYKMTTELIGFGSGRLSGVVKPSDKQILFLTEMSYTLYADYFH
jgi:hypothetical protein